MSLLRQFERLQTRMDQLEAKLDLRDAGYADLDHLDSRELRERIADISGELGALGRRSKYVQD